MEMIYKQLNVGIRRMLTFDIETQYFLKGFLGDMDERKLKRKNERNETRADLIESLSDWRIGYSRVMCRTRCVSREVTKPLFVRTNFSSLEVYTTHTQFVHHQSCNVTSNLLNINQN
jgi:hypothetical protein